MRTRSGRITAAGIAEDAGGLGETVGVRAPQAPESQRVERCFRCPRQRREDETGWYFLDIQERRRGRIRRLRAYVCPRDYFQFAASERVRWTPILSARVEPLDDATIVPLQQVAGPSELIATLSNRGLTGWALLVRDVAEGRIRRLHLRKLPADPKIREAMVAFLNSAGAEITLERDLVPHSLLEDGDSKRASIG